MASLLNKKWSANHEPVIKGYDLHVKIKDNKAGNYLFVICKHIKFINIHANFKRHYHQPLILKVNKHVLMPLNYSGSLFIELT
jgi:hypothetical protein